MKDIVSYNKKAWNKQVSDQNEWTIPVSSEEISRARNGDFAIVLTPTIPVPRNWFPDDLAGLKILALASGGGQQGPILAAAGAEVTVFDNSPIQLGQDQKVATREQLTIRTVEGNMLDLHQFSDGEFDLIFHPCSNCFVPNILPVWQECARVLKVGGRLLAGLVNPVVFTQDPALEKQGIVQMKYKIPYSDLESMTEEERTKHFGADAPLSFGHSLQDQIGGQLMAGFSLTGFFEDHWAKDTTAPIHAFLACYIATMAIKN